MRSVTRKHPQCYAFGNFPLKALRKSLFILSVVQLQFLTTNTNV